MPVKAADDGRPGTLALIIGHLSGNKLGIQQLPPSSAKQSEGGDTKRCREIEVSKDKTKGRDLEVHQDRWERMKKQDKKAPNRKLTEHKLQTRKVPYHSHQRENL